MKVPYPDISGGLLHLMPDHPALAITVRSLLLEQYGRISAEIAGGYVDDWAGYREKVGVLKGIDLAISICDQAKENLDKR